MGDRDDAAAGNNDSDSWSEFEGLLGDAMGTMRRGDLASCEMFLVQALDFAEDIVSRLKRRLDVEGEDENRLKEQLDLGLRNLARILRHLAMFYERLNPPRIEAAEECWDRALDLREGERYAVSLIFMNFHLKPSLI